MVTDNGWTPETLKQYVDALRAAEIRAIDIARSADLRAVELVREWTRERLDAHNNLLTKWQEATAIDRSTFATNEALVALTTSFDVYKDITARALALAEGKSKGFDAIRTGLSFVAGLFVAGVSAWALLKGLH